MLMPLVYQDKLDLNSTFIAQKMIIGLLQLYLADCAEGQEYREYLEFKTGLSLYLFKGDNWNFAKNNLGIGIIYYRQFFQELYITTVDYDNMSKTQLLFQLGNFSSCKTSEH